MSDRALLLHRSPWRGVVHVTGGGSGFLSELLQTPGASKTVLEATIPYASGALADLLGSAPHQACSEPTARAMAMAAYLRARTLGTPSNAFGLACTASLATDRVKRGAFRAHIALQTLASTSVLNVQLTGDRAPQENDLVDAIWSVCATSLLDGPTSELVEVTTGPLEWQSLIEGETNAYCAQAHDRMLVLPGSFNPLHDGHVAMLETASEMTGESGAFEISVTNVDKPPLDYRELTQRLNGMPFPTWLTRAPTFADKAELFPGAWFAVGVDTLTRIGMTRYYANALARDHALDKLAWLGARFLAFGRVSNGEFLTLSHLHLPTRLSELCTPVPEDRFRSDVSSTDIRQLKS